jgi:hypothetical protein
MVSFRLKEEGRFSSNPTSHSPKMAAVADVSIPTIKRLEAVDGPLGGRSETGEKIRKALESAGIEFIAENGGRPGRATSKATIRKIAEMRRL